MSRIWKVSSIIGEFPIDYNPPPPKEEEKNPAAEEWVTEEPSPSPEEEREEILKAAHQKAQTLLDNARKESRALVEEARKESQTLLLTAKKEGLAKGHQEAKEIFRKRTREIFNRLEVSLQEVDHRMKKYEQEYPAKITQLSLGIAREVIRREVKEDPAIVLQVTKEALSSMNGVAEATIRVNWKDLQVMEEAKEDLLASLKGFRRVQFQVDNDLDAGGIVIETPQGGIDASIETRFSKITAGLLEVVKNE